MILPDTKIDIYPQKIMIKKGLFGPSFDIEGGLFQLIHDQEFQKTIFAALHHQKSLKIRIHEMETHHILVPSEQRFVQLVHDQLLDLFSNHDFHEVRLKINGKSLVPNHSFPWQKGIVPSMAALIIGLLIFKVILTHSLESSIAKSKKHLQKLTHQTTQIARQKQKTTPTAIEEWAILLTQLPIAIETAFLRPHQGTVTGYIPHDKVSLFQSILSGINQHYPSLKSQFSRMSERFTYGKVWW